jgi:peptidoglycan/xylan/chitin deacetylase (PgdA/CDA1 family)
MALRPIAVSVVLAAALLGTNVLHDGGAAVLDGPISAVTGPVPSSGATPGSPDGSGGPATSPGAAPGGSPAPGASAPATQPSPPPPGGPVTMPVGPVSAADVFRVWEHGPRTAKLVALTFDDGWNLRDLRGIVAILKAKQAPATFFPVGRAVLRHPETWKQIAAAGFPIGNHSWNHDDLSRGPASKALKDMNRATQAIERTAGVRLFPAIRPPFGTYDASFMQAAQEAGMRAVIMWDVDTRDWSGVRAPIVVREALTAQRGSIIVMHTDKTNTVHALPKIIDRLRAKGYTLVTVGQLIGLPGPVPVFMDREQREFQKGR